MKYRHQFLVRAPLEAVADFHASSSSMAAITPPPIRVEIHQAPLRLQEGDEMDFTLWLGVLPVRWLARIQDVSACGFTDWQIRGPFGRWEHRHNFEEHAGGTVVTDEVRAQLSSHPFWALVSWSMWLGMPLLFAFRGWKTRRLLENRAEGV